MNQQFVTAPQPTMKRVADVDGPDFYPTPRWATHALIDNERFSGDIWECACGDGEMSCVLGPVEIHRVRMTVAPIWTIASKLVSVLHARMAMR